MNRPGLTARLYPEESRKILPFTPMPTEPIRAAAPVVSPVSETANPTPQQIPGTGTVYNDMTSTTWWLIVLTRVLYGLSLVGSSTATITGYLPLSWAPYIALAVGLIPGVEWFIRQICDWLDNGALDGSYPGSGTRLAILTGALLLLSGSLIGCATFRSAATQHELIRDGATAATMLVLDAAVSPADLQSKKVIVHDISVVIAQLASGNTPTPAELNAALTRYIGTSVSKWSPMVGALNRIYAQEYAKVGGDGKAAILILRDIAAGVADATEMPQ